MWWARQDSNLQPDRYERPALTIELQAPPACRFKRQATVPTPLTMWLAIRQCRGGCAGTLARPAALTGAGGCECVAPLASCPDLIRASIVSQHASLDDGLPGHARQ